MKRNNGWSWLAALLIVPAAALAQTEASQTAATAGPPVQRINTATALSTEQLGSITSVRELPDGRVLVNDGTRRRLLLMDTTLRTVEVVLDSLSEIANTYGTRAAALIPFRGDTTLFVDPASYAIVVIDPAGKPVRVRSVWKVQEVSYYTNSTGMYGWPGVDSEGRVVYRIPAQPAPPRVRPPAGVPYIPPQPDSAFIIAVDLDTRMADTLGSIRIPKAEMVMRQSGPEGFFFFDQAINPMPSTDEWALLPDGTVAFVRWRDYRVEYRNADGTVTSSGKLPFEWQRITEDDKQRMVDSVRAVQQKNARNNWISSIIRWVNLYNRDFPVGFTIPDDYVPMPGFAKDWIFPPGMKFPENYMYACPPGVEPNSAATRVVASGDAPPTAAARTPPCVPAPVVGGTAPPVPTLRPITVMGAAEMPDYRPPIGAGSVRADADDNLWIRTNPPKPVPGGPVYDIVSRQGELVNRLQLPPGYTLVGFGKDKVVYLSMRDASGIHLARVRLR